MPLSMLSSINRTVNTSSFHKVPSIIGIVTVNSITGGTYTTGISNTNGINYQVYVLTQASASYTINYSNTAYTQCYVLAVGGGGCGGAAPNSGGGGGGGVVMTPVNLPSGINQSISVTVGDGTKTIQNGGFAPSTTATFATGTTPLSIIAGGGGNGTNTSILAANPNGGSAGGGYGNTIQLDPSVNFFNINKNFANTNGAASSSTTCSGGGGAGIAGYNINGGSGIRCFLPGIKDFNPSGTPYGNYYWGGGGGGSSAGQTPATGGIGGAGGGGSGNGQLAVDTNGINIAGSSTTIAGGAGATNTGGGGGGGTTNGGGVGGSGIFIIAFPISAVTSNTSSTLTNASLTTTTYNSMCGAYGCQLLNYNYYGPIFTLRSSADTTGSNTKNFYADVCGNNIGDGYLGTGTSLNSWLTSMGGATGYAFITKWYDQGMDNSFNCATQYNTNLQPIYQITPKVLNFGYTTGYIAGTDYPSSWPVNAGNAYFRLPNGALPYGDSSFTYVYKHNLYSSDQGACYVISGNVGTYYSATAIYIRSLITTNSYRIDFWNDAFSTATNSAAAGQVITNTYTTGAGTNSRVIWINDTSANNTPTRVRSQPYTNNYIGYAYAVNNGTYYYCPAQIYYIYVTSNVITDSDRKIIQKT